MNNFFKINLQRTNLEEAFRKLERDPTISSFDEIQDQSLKKEIQEEFWTQSNFYLQLFDLILSIRLSN